jgi:restriction system protein
MVTPEDKLPDGWLPGGDFGLQSLIQHWRLRQAGTMKSFAPPPLPLVVAADSIITTDEAVIRPSGIDSAEAFGDGSVNPLPEIVIASGFVVLGDKHAEGRLVLGVGTMWLDMISEAQRDPTALLKMSPREFEEFLAGLYERQGFWDEIILTPRSGDKGRDVILSATKRGMGTIRLIDQAKRYAPRYRVTSEQVSSMAGILLRDQNVSKAIITTTSDFAPGASKDWEKFIPERLELRNGPKLLEWMSEIKA